ncbi:MAG: reverse transcriptase domain-containing protein [Candidatus Woesearchaeota archaeon]
MWYLNNRNNDSNANSNNNLNNNNGRLVGIVKLLKPGLFVICMVSDDALYQKICSYDNLELAFSKASLGKSSKQYMLEFKSNLYQNLWQLRYELLLQVYQPRPLETFILRDPKTRKISKSNFRDRVVHHALCNIIEPVFEKSFICDSYANRIGKGTLKAIERFDYFKRKVSKNNIRNCFVLKADIKHYFETVDHKILLSIIRRKITNPQVLWLVEVILSNHHTDRLGKGMPLGNLTSQFFANVYLNELDQFVKHQLRSEYYIRYVDDFLILNKDREVLLEYKAFIEHFLKEHLGLELHPEKSKIMRLQRGIIFLGMRAFFHYRIIRRKNTRKFNQRMKELHRLYSKGLITREKAVGSLEGWLAYLFHADTYKYRRDLLQRFEQKFPLSPNTAITNLQKHENYVQQIEYQKLPFSVQKTLYLFKKELNIPQISQERRCKESTIWQHLANLIGHHQLSIRDVLPEDKIKQILPCIFTEKDLLRDIKSRIKNQDLMYDEINCVLASVKVRCQPKRIFYLVKWYQKINCFRKCYSEQKQRKECRKKLELFASQNIGLSMRKRDFIQLFNQGMKICILPEREKERYVSWKEFTGNIEVKTR